jgi:predicted RNA-binding Zn ribbon-like protein
METTGHPVEQMLLAGGHPSLDFVNTLGGLRSLAPGPADDHLHAYGDLLTFGVRSRTLSKDDAAALRAEAERRPADARAAFRAALELRELISATLRPLAYGDSPGEDLLRRLRQADEDALGHAVLEPAGPCYRWSWPCDPRDLEAPLWPLAHGAVELLTSQSLARLSGCRRCRWLFLDMSKNRSRRWCSMEGCGTDEKKERYIERRRVRRGSASRAR